MPQPLIEHLAKNTEQGAFGWRREAWQTALHDDDMTLALLDRLDEHVDREITRTIVLEELSAGRVTPAFVAAMIWGYGKTGYGPARVRWVLTGVRGRASATAPIRSDVLEKLAVGAKVARDSGPVEGFKYMNNAGKVLYLGALSSLSGSISPPQLMALRTRMPHLSSTRRWPDGCGQTMWHHSAWIRRLPTRTTCACCWTGVIGLGGHQPRLKLRSST